MWSKYRSGDILTGSLEKGYYGVAIFWRFWKLNGDNFIQKEKMARPCFCCYCDPFLFSLLDYRFHLRFINVIFYLYVKVLLWIKRVWIKETIWKKRVFLAENLQQKKTSKPKDSPSLCIMQSCSWASTRQVWISPEISLVHKRLYIVETNCLN